ncbi:hypothetical protein HOE67_01310 [Candidatus Peregrinibacteria bacterium]|nr:hypothetical protein [Candidatus Peregrinibacteria bacterium]MBT4055725.1 hypothetical protein [Candidatus Peregrinibacteria bacterium]
MKKQTKKSGLQVWDDYIKRWDKKLGAWKKVVDKRLLDHDRDVLDIHTTLREIKEDMYTKTEHSEFMACFDAAITELKMSRESREAYGYRFSVMDDQLTNHGKRIEVLESK